MFNRSSNRVPAVRDGLAYIRQLMAEIGQEIVNPVTRERIVWRHTAASTADEFAEFDLHLGEGATVAGRHTHPNQREDFRVERGAILLRQGKSDETLAPGDERSVAAGVPHSWANVGDGDAHVVVRFTPALRSEDFFETFFALAQAGKLNKRGLPRNPLLLATWLHEYRREIGPPTSLQRLAATPIFATLAPIGRLTGLTSQVRP
jgi:quercetin dioxygenase-like cupin family protein